MSPRLRHLIDVLVQISAFVLPAVGVAMLEVGGLQVASTLAVVVTIPLMLTSLVSLVETLLGSRRRPHPPREVDTQLEDRRPVTVIIAAYLPNEVDIIAETVRSCLALESTPTLQVICAYNTPSPMPVEGELATLAAQDARFIALHVPASTTKAANINAALALATGEICGILDADHRLAPDALRRARRQMRPGVDVVQGHCAVRDGTRGMFAASIAVEYEAMYGLTHPGRRTLFGFGVFGGANGWWRTSVLQDIRFDPRALTEDIDASIRLVSAGGRIEVDPDLLSWELSPPSVRAFVRQRRRWAQGWLQVGQRRLGAMLRSPVVSARSKAGALWMFAWCPIMPWLNAAIPGLVIERAVRGALPVSSTGFLVLALATTVVGPAQIALAWRRAPQQLRRRWEWFLVSFVTGLVLAVLRDTAARSAAVGAMVKDHEWRVTPRTKTPETTRVEPVQDVAA